jgi:hypothetical protein
VEGSCEYGDEPLGSIKRCEVLEELHNWRLLKKGSAPWSYLVYQYILALQFEPGKFPVHQTRLGIERLINKKFVFFNLTLTKIWCILY